VKSSLAGLVGIVALAAIVAGHIFGLGYIVGVAVALSAVFGYGWPHYLGIPAKKTLGAVIALTGAAAALTSGLTADANFLVWTPIFIAFGFGAVLVVQLIRGTGQAHRLESTLGAGAGVLIAGFAGGGRRLALRRRGGRHARTGARSWPVSSGRVLTLPGRLQQPGRTTPVASFQARHARPVSRTWTRLQAVRPRGDGPPGTCGTCARFVATA